MGWRERSSCEERRRWRRIAEKALRERERGREREANETSNKKRERKRSCGEINILFLFFGHLFIFNVFYITFLIFL